MILIIQTGDPVSAAQQKYGTFDQWFTQGMGLPQSFVKVINVHQQQQLPELSQVDEINGIIITGSPAMVTDKNDWLLDTQRWLEVALEQQTPTLGICFGHQLLADLWGGKVDYNVQGRNLGLSQFTLTQAAQSDDLLGHLHQQKSIPTFASHLQHVKNLPTSAVRLGSCEIDENHAFRIGNHIWGLQFHPEWNAAITQTYIEARINDLQQEDFNPKTMIQALRPCSEAHNLLAIFKTLTENDLG